MVKFEEDDFGFVEDKTTGKSIPVRRFTWKNSSNVTVQVITYGATITSIKVPDKNGKIEDVVLGFDNIQGYLQSNNPYFGATIGRVANRIAQSKFTIDNVTYNVTPNRAPNHLHGGAKGFDKVVWNHYVVGQKLFLSYLSKDGEEGYPGDVLTTVSFELTDKNEFRQDFQATSTKPTPVNLTNHSYFNLAGDNAGSKGLYNHKVAVNADEISEVDANGIPSGNLLPVFNTNFDLRIARTLGDIINDVPNAPGFDHNFVLNRADGQGLGFAASAHHVPSGRVLQVYSNQPAVQFYTGNFLPTNGSLVGKNGNKYEKHGAFCFETQIHPDAINHSNFPNVVLYPGKVYEHSLYYRFSVQA